MLFQVGSKSCLYPLGQDGENLVQVIGDLALRESLSAHSELERMIAAFLDAYRTARTRHIALLIDVKFLGPAQRDAIIARERAVIDAFAAVIKRAFPERVTAANERALTMLLMGAMNWTFTWLKPDGAFTYADYAAEVTRVIMQGMGGAAPVPG